MLLKKIVKGAILGLASLLVALGIYEGILRLFFEPPQLIDIKSSQSPVSNAMSSKREQIRLVLTTETGRRLRPNTRVTVHHHSVSKRNIVVETNSIGYRNRELGEKRGKRILFLGDSITLADYVGEEETFVRIAERMLKNIGHPVETINAGVGGEGLETYFHILKETGLATRPDVVIVNLYLNDFQSSRTIPWFYPPEFLRGTWAANYLYQAVSVKYAKLTRTKEDWDDNMRRVPEAELMQWQKTVQCCFVDLEPASKEGASFQQNVLGSVHDWGGAWSTGSWRRMSEILGTMKRTLDQAGIRMLVVVFPVSYQVAEATLYDFPQRQVKQIGKNFGFPVLDVLPLLRGHRNQSPEELFYDHCHYTPLGNQLIAAYITDEIIRLGLISSQKHLTTSISVEK